MSSLSWAWDGDVEAQMQGHNISIEQHNDHHHQDDPSNTDINNLANQDSELDHDHHCNISAHLVLAMLSQSWLPTKINNTFNTFECTHLYLPPDSNSALRPPIS